MCRAQRHSGSRINYAFGDVEKLQRQESAPLVARCVRVEVFCESEACFRIVRENWMLRDSKSSAGIDNRFLRLILPAACEALSATARPNPETSLRMREVAALVPCRLACVLML